MLRRSSSLHLLRGLPDVLPAPASHRTGRPLTMTENHVNYAAPGAVVGIQAQNVVITGGLVFTDDGVEFGQQPDAEAAPAISAPESE